MSEFVCLSSLTYLKGAGLVMACILQSEISIIWMKPIEQMEISLHFERKKYG